MAASYLHSLWGNLWMSHREIKELLTFSWRRKAPRAELVKAGSGVDSASASSRTEARSSESTKSSEPAQESGDPGPGYTPARIIGLILGPLLFVGTLVFFDPEGLSPEGKAVLASTLWIATWWITEAIPIPVTSLLPVALLPLTGALEGDAVVAAYGDDIIFLFLGGFSLALAMEKWNLHQRIALTIVAAIGTSPRRIILGFMVATGFLSMWVSNTAATMMMIPVGLAVVYQASLSMRGGSTSPTWEVREVHRLRYRLRGHHRRSRHTHRNTAARRSFGDRRKDLR